MCGTVKRRGNFHFIWRKSHAGDWLMKGINFSTDALDLWIIIMYIAENELLIEI
jgi:hypothetical protein